MDQVFRYDDRKLFWQLYKERIVANFRAMSREQQETVIRKGSIAMTVGICILFVNAIYGVVPAILRVLGVPALLIGSYYAGKRFITQLVIKKLERHMNP